VLVSGALSTPDAGIDEGVVVGYPNERGPQVGLELGPGARLRRGTIIYAASRIGRGLATGHNVVIREECTIGDDVSVWSNSVIDYGCEVGDDVKIHANCYVAQFTWIGAGAFLAPGVTLANDLYPGRDDSAAAMAGPTIEAGAQLGVNVTVLPYVTIGAGALVGAGAVVTRDVEPGTVVIGSPATPRGSTRDLPGIDDRVRTVDGRHRLLGGTA
jgi:UDP-3-O-[3-hydroxymyristoyl] glucosamine N-acyltransferase